jgi:hypothetical protein
MKVLKKVNPEEIVRERLIGMTLLRLGYGANEPGNRRVTLDQEITEVEVGMDESREDAGWWITLKNSERVFVHASEEIEVEMDTTPKGDRHEAKDMDKRV